MAATGTGDGQWSLIVAWTVRRWSARRGRKPGGMRAARGRCRSTQRSRADKEWQRRVLAAVGNYGDIFERNLGKGSPLKLDRGLNANQPCGGLLLSPFIE